MLRRDDREKFARDITFLFFGACSLFTRAGWHRNPPTAEQVLHQTGHDPCPSRAGVGGLLIVLAYPLYAVALRHPSLAALFAAWFWSGMVIAMCSSPIDSSWPWALGGPLVWQMLKC